jgi:plastocyanin
MSVSALFRGALDGKRRRGSSSDRLWLSLAIALLLVAVPAFAASVYTVIQRGRAFSTAEITVERGDTTRFTNEDEFLHQIYVDSNQMSFDSDEQRPGQTIEVQFPKSGTFPVRCHIHPKMLLTVRVK